VVKQIGYVVINQEGIHTFAVEDLVSLSGLAVSPVVAGVFSLCFLDANFRL
jgi:hypothetical protein